VLYLQIIKVRDALKTKNPAKGGYNPKLMAKGLTYLLPL
jgi:hypothetical protein